MALPSSYRTKFLTFLLSILLSLGVLVAGGPVTDGIYKFELCSGRGSCSSTSEYLGWNNQSCHSGVPPHQPGPGYGKTVGPMLRGSNSESSSWNLWQVHVTGQDGDATMAKLQNTYRKDTTFKPKCSGYYMVDYYTFPNDTYHRNYCRQLPWAKRVHLHEKGHQWKLKPVPNTDCFNIIDSRKPAGCFKYLSASKDCAEKYMDLTAKDDGSGLQRWRMVRVGGPAPPAVKTKPMLLVVGASTSTSGVILFKPTPGASSCTVSLLNPLQAPIVHVVKPVAYPYSTWYPYNLNPGTNYEVELKCTVGKTEIPAVQSKELGTPSEKNVTTVNVLPVSQGYNFTVMSPDPLTCQPASYKIQVTPVLGGATKEYTSSSPNFVIPDLKPGVSYSVVATALCSDGSQRPSSTFTLTTPPSSPSSSTPPPPPSSPGSNIIPCTSKTTIDVLAVSMNSAVLQAKLPTSSPPYQLSASTSCNYEDGSSETLSSGWISASLPTTTLQVHVKNPGTCTVTVFVQQLGQSVPVSCPSAKTIFSIKSGDTTPGITVPQTPTPNSFIFTVIKPVIACDGIKYSISAKPVTGTAVVMPLDPLTSGYTSTMQGLTPNTKYAVSVQGTCPDGSKTQESGVVTVSTPCDASQNFKPTPVNGACVCEDGYSLKNGVCVMDIPCPIGQIMVNGKCTPCTPVQNCAKETCTFLNNSTCIKCNVGYTLKSGKCVAITCGSGSYYNAAAGACYPCMTITGCSGNVTCTSSTNLQCSQCDATNNFVSASNGTCKCKAGFWLNPQDVCKQCTAVNGCATVSCTSATDSKCTKCDAAQNFNPSPVNGACVCADGYSLKSGVCVPTAPCSIGQVLINGNCTPCTPLPNCAKESCTALNNSTCVKCNVGYTLKNGKCVAVTCGSGSYYNAAAGACYPCLSVTGCSGNVTCTSSSNSQCSQCDTNSNFVSATDGTCKCKSGFWRNKNTCTACTSLVGCTAVTCTSASSSTCTACNTAGHFELVNGSCSCSSGYIASGSGCKKDPCASVATGANTNGAGNVAFAAFIPFENPEGGSTFPPGKYEIRYHDGCMKYGAAQGWTVNALFPDYGWYIGAQLKDKIAQAPGAEGYGTPCPGTPGNGCGFPDSGFEDCVAFSKTLPAINITLNSNSTLGFWVQDGPAGTNFYSDNVAGSNGRNPSWSIRSLSCKST